MKKAVAIPYVIALILGVIVVAVLAYWFISSGGKGAGIGKEAECTARKTEFCATQLSEKLNKINEPNGCDTQWVGCKVFEYCSTLILGWKSISPSIPNEKCK